MLSIELIALSLNLKFGFDIVSFDPNEDDAVCIEPDSDVDDKLMEVGSDICMSDGGDMINLYDEKHFLSHSNVGEPYTGMEFESEEAAMAYYDAYAKRVDFIVRIGNCHRSSQNGSIINRRFVCNKEGFRVSNSKVKRVEVRKPRAVTREGCKAMIMIRKESSGAWIIVKLETQHSHPLGASLGKACRGPVRPQLQVKHLLCEIYAYV